MSRTYTFEQFVNLPREEAAAIIEAENKEFHEAVQRACSDGLEVAPHHYGFADEDNFPVPALAGAGLKVHSGESPDGEARDSAPLIAPPGESRDGESPWLTGPTAEECAAPVEATEPEVD